MRNVIIFYVVGTICWTFDQGKMEYGETDSLLNDK